MNLVIKISTFASQVLNDSLGLFFLFIVKGERKEISWRKNCVTKKIELDDLEHSQPLPLQITELRCGFPAVKAYFREKAEGVMFQPFANTQEDQKQSIQSHKGPFKRLRMCLTDSPAQTRGPLDGLTMLSLSDLSRELRYGRVYLIKIFGYSFL